METLQERNDALIAARGVLMDAMGNICDDVECDICKNRRSALNAFQKAAIKYGKESAK